MIAQATGLLSDLLFVVQRLGAKDKGHTITLNYQTSESIIEA
jgi:hypothetical protein